MQDLVLDENYDLVIENGDFKISDSQSQSVELLLLSKPGEWKQHPEAGCDIVKAKNGVIDRFLDREIRLQLEADGFRIEKMKLTETGIDLSGEYGS